MKLDITSKVDPEVEYRTPPYSAVDLEKVHITKEAAELLITTAPPVNPAELFKKASLMQDTVAYDRMDNAPPSDAATHGRNTVSINKILTNTLSYQNYS
jgi:hypothetical protein